MKKSIMFIISASAFMMLAACGKTSTSSEVNQESSITLPTSEEKISSSIEQASSESSSTLSSSVSSVTSSISSEPTDTPDGWEAWSEGDVAKIEALLADASSKEANVVSNKIRNGTVSNGESSYAEYSFKKGKRRNGETACYHKTPNQTSYYYYDDKVIGGYVEKSVAGEKVISKATSINDNRFNGYDMSTLMIKSGNGFCGGYASLRMMVDNGIANANKDTKFKIDTNGFEMSYAIYSKVTYTYWDAKISAKFANDGTLTGLKYKYAESYAKNVDKKEDGTFAFKVDAVLDYKETVYEAVAGTLEILPMPVDPSTLNYASFDIYYGDTKVEAESTLNADIGENGVVLDIRNIAPSSASTNFDEWIVAVKKGTAKANTDDNYFDSAESKVYLASIQAAGTYEVTITTKKILIHFTVVVGVSKAESISFIGLVQETWGMSPVEVKNAIAVGDSTNICALVNPTPASQETTLTITAPEGVAESDYSVTNKTVKSGDVTLNYIVFSSTKPGAFIFNAVAKEDASITATHTLNVTTPLSADDLFNGKYCYYNEYTNKLVYTLEFTPNKGTSKLGDGEVKVTTISSGKYGLYTYVASNGGKTVTLTYETGIDGTVQDLFDAKVTSTGSRDSLILVAKEEPVGWGAANMKLLDWPDYESKYLQ